MTPQTASAPRWRDDPASSLNGLQRAWLCQPGALTAGLRALGEVHLFVRREAVAALPGIWAGEAGLRPGAAVWWREILMTVDGRPCVQACSFTPWTASLGAWKAMRGLGRRPLADILYQDARILRSAFRFGRLRVQQTESPWVAPAGSMIEARHSVFTRLGAPLLVAEYFLPAFWGLAARPGATGPRRRFPRCGCGQPVPPA